MKKKKKSSREKCFLAHIHNCIEESEEHWKACVNHVVSNVEERINPTVHPDPVHQAALEAARATLTIIISSSSESETSSSSSESETSSCSSSSSELTDAENPYFEKPIEDAEAELDCPEEVKEDE